MANPSTAAHRNAAKALAGEAARWAAVTAAIDLAVDDIIMVTEAEPGEEPGPRIVFVNDNFTRLTGYAAAEAIGRSPRFLKGTPGDLETYETIRAQLADGTMVHRRVVDVTKAGRPLIVDTNQIPLRDKAGAVTHVIALSRPVPDTGQGRPGSLLATAAQAAAAPIAIVDSAGLLISVNDAMCLLLGYPLHDMIGRPTLDFVVPAKRDGVRGHHQDMVARAASSERATTLFHADGRQLDVLATGTSIDMKGVGRFRIITFQPILTDAAEDDWAGFERQARRLAARPIGDKPAMAGMLRILGFDEAKAALGERWPGFAKRALALADGLIRQSLGRQEIHARNGEDGFLICFVGGTEEEATRRATALAERITAALLDEARSAATLRAETTLRPLSEAFDPVTTDDTPFAERLVARLEERRVAAQTAARELLGRVVQEAKPVAEPVQGCDGALVPICFAALPEQLAQQIDTALQSLGNEPQAVRDMDVLLPGLAVDRWLAENRPELLILPVPFAIFAERRRAEAFLAFGRKLAERSPKQLALCLQHIPPGTSQFRLAEIIAQLTSLVKRILVELDEPEARPIDYLQLKLPTVVIAATALWRRGEFRAAAFGRLLRSLQARDIRLIVRQVPDEAAASVLRAAGADFITYRVVD